MRADQFEWGQSWAADFFLRPPALTASNFEALWSIDQRAAKLIAVDVRGLKKSLPASPGPSQTSRPGFELYQGQFILKV